ncbi:MAG: flagellar filament capping protein FliD, partial [Planctomycetes bacterium]|nr:flagellar filament capping protein FliD [Planctomycetota bacterium]
TVNDVLSAINNETALSVTASVEGGHLVLSHPTLEFEVQDSQGYTTATSLGIKGTSGSFVLTGLPIHYLSSGSALSLLNDGNGVYQDTKSIAAGSLKYDFQIFVEAPGGGDDVTVKVNISTIHEEITFEVLETAVTSLGGAIQRINDAFVADGIDAHINAAISADGTRIEITRTDAGGDIQVFEHLTTPGNTAADLGIWTEDPVTLGAGGTHPGDRLLAGLNSTLVSNLVGGGTDLGDGAIIFTLRDGSSFTATVDLDGSVNELMRKIEVDSELVAGVNRVSVTLDATGTGIVITDLNSGAGTLIISGTVGANTALALGIETDLAGVASDTVSSGNLQHAYLSHATQLTDLNHNKGVGTGSFTITDSTGAQTTITIDSGDRSIGDVIKSINGGSAIKVRARINDTGDGILLYEPGAAIGQKITVTDETGAVARGLGITGEASGDGAENFIDGSFERRVEFDATDTLDDVARKINEAGADVTASVVSTGSGSNPYKLSLSSKFSGDAGRFILDTGGYDLGHTTLETGRDAVVFFGGGDPATAELLVSSSNTLDNILGNVTIDLKQTSTEPIQVTITRDNESIEDKVVAFVESFNDLIKRIDFQTRYDQETEIRGPLLGDSTMIGLRTVLFNTMFGESENVTGTFDRLLQVGLTIGAGGVIEFDRDRFREAMEQDLESVEALFAERVLKPKVPQPIPGVPGATFTDPNARDEFSSLGVVGQLEELARRYIDSVDGVLTLRTRSLDDQIALQNRRIAQFDIQLQAQRVKLERQFLAMEKAIASLQGMQGIIASISALR